MVRVLTFLRVQRVFTFSGVQMVRVPTFLGVQMVRVLTFSGVRRVVCSVHCLQVALEQWPVVCSLWLLRRGSNILLPSYCRS